MFLFLFDIETMFAEIAVDLFTAIAGNLPGRSGKFVLVRESLRSIIPDLITVFVIKKRIAGKKVALIDR